jgi:conjugal transfer pilus assembly protein TraW
MVGPFAVALLLSLKVAPSCIMAKDFGTQGLTFPIEEEDPIVLIQNKLKEMEQRGELEEHTQELQKKTKARIQRPTPVKGIRKAQKGKVFFFDPTYVVSEDLKDHQGRVFAKKGTRINPLEKVSLSSDLLFIDGDDEDQVAFAKAHLEKGTCKLILIKGEPLDLSEELQTLVYFDQQGSLTQKLNITQVPALVTQEGLRLRIEEIELEEALPTSDTKTE